MSQAEKPTIMSALQQPQLQSMEAICSCKEDQIQ